jgi:transcriptional antiterminator RfaH
MQHWYALHTKVYAEKQAAHELRRHGIETYLPEVKAKVGKTAEKKIAFFPGYLFMNVDLSKTNAANWRWASGVRYIVSQGEVPVVIPPEIIGHIRRQLDARETASSQKSKDRFKKGDRVRIGDGAFADMLAVFEGDISSSERATVLMEFLGRLSRIRVDLESLELIETGSNSGPKSGPKRRTRGRGRPIRYDD